LLLVNKKLREWTGASAKVKRLEGESEAEYFERIAPTRWDRYISGIEQRAIMAAHGYVPSPSVVLDIGAGIGRWSQVLSRLGWKLVCTDVDAKSLAICQRRTPGGTCLLVTPNAQTLPVANGSCGMIICMEVHHVVAATWFVDEVSRVLVPSGLLVGVCGNRRSLRGIFKHAFDRAHGPKKPDHYSTSYPLLKKKLIAKGFELLREEGLCWLPFSRSSNSRLIDPLATLERRLGLNRLPDLSPWVVFVARKLPSTHVAQQGLANREMPVGPT